MSQSSTASAPSPTSSPQGGGGGGGGPTSSPLLFFVALGFGVVFTNLWIIVGVKYCFRYNQRNRQARALADGQEIDMGSMPRPHRRRREKKLMSMEDVNERFPLTKYKTWRATREQEGLPAAGGIAGSRAGSLKDAEGVLGKSSMEEARPETAIAQAQQDHVAATAAENNKTKPPAADDSGMRQMENLPMAQAKEHYAPGAVRDSDDLERSQTVASITADPKGQLPQPTTIADDDDDDDEDDPIRTAAPPEMLAAPGDTCAICLDTLEDDDDVRGLTCGHAFHAACVDPWLTGRRACCPLCKHDYYVPKPRPEGERQQQEDGNQPTRRATGLGGIRLTPPAPTRYGFGRNRLHIFASSRHDTRPEHESRAPAQTQTQTQTTEQGTSGWRTFVPFRSQRRPTTSPNPVPSVPSPPQPAHTSQPSWFGRFRNRNLPQTSADAANGQTDVTPSALEAGRG
ncbi:hypothetical protein EJ05DRAFT_151001 [Pseudovirgaria hyperparasitica]|uniref:RING-type domain-containing protein n=1 Tax=Pseudovirgaria hyperparasitica TaxID=470096 RepID=A0A6A6VWK5_9PEZI|nr:uncharacterized protein EJ05DRAFT_151001 [Pseudovirgaria hyperparasitica]KAF2754176.1 hypothetical protein EJ05DRAFT_151001 [Pseudovirgaria hyperparasitica]